MDKTNKKRRPGRKPDKRVTAGIQVLKKATKPFTLADAKKAGVSQPTLWRLMKKGEIVRVGHGRYMHKNSSVKPEYQDYAIACAIFGPKAVISGLTALFYYRLIDAPPSKIWLSVLPEQKTAHSEYRILRTKLNPDVGVEEHGAFRMATIERSIVEALHFATKIGIRTAMQAARRAIAEGKTSDVKIARIGKELGLTRTIDKYWELIVT